MSLLHLEITRICHVCRCEDGKDIHDAALVVEVVLDELELGLKATNVFKLAVIVFLQGLHIELFRLREDDAPSGVLDEDHLLDVLGKCSTFGLVPDTWRSEGEHCQRSTRRNSDLFSANAEDTGLWGRRLGHS